MAVLVSNIPPCHISAPGTLVSPSSPASLDLAIVHDATDYASTPRALVGGLDLVAALEPLSEPVLEPTSSSEYCLISHKRPHDDSEDDVLDLAPQQKRWRQDDSVITNVIQDPFFTHSWGHTQFYPTGSDFLATPESQDAAAIAAILNLPSFDQALNASSQPNTGISFSPADVPAPEPCEWPPSFEMDMARGPSSPVMMAPTNDADVFQPQQTSQQQQQQQQHIMCEDQDAVGEPESASKPVLDPVIEPQPEPESGNNNSNENVRPRHEPSLWIRACKSRLALL
ncbi:hypothetical protein K474DRAFT_1036582 [Panus rudis PR-1116 ss-1]|nr:hypothetical protein K474DRAFT_1036582 [Panus rudis PR-1116 ss-1]